MTFVFHPDAKAELDATAEHYEQTQPGLGLAFIDEAYAAILRIQEYPDAWARLSAHTRRCLLHRFPYSLVYQIKPEHMLILAVAHRSRRPGYWNQRRLRQPNA